MAKTVKKQPIDFVLLISILILLSFGIIMVFSASDPYARNNYQDPYYILKNQLLYAAIGMGCMFAASAFNYRKLEKLAPFAVCTSIILLILVLMPPFGRETKETWRWMYIGSFQFQPSEIAKFSVILFFSASLAKRRNDLQYFFKGLLPYFAIIGICAVLLLKEPHLSATIIVVLVAFVLLFTAGAKISHFIILFTPMAAALSVVVAVVPYMRDRVLSFLDPWKDITGDGWQAVQSLYAIGSGGIFGRGLGKSMQKFMWIPEPHNDFIFSVLAEELGFVGVATVLVLFMLFTIRGLKIAINAPDIFGSLLAAGITSLIAIQALLNVAVVTSSIPPTGVTLPFFSAGGTSLFLFMTQAGVLLNISRYASYERI